jgi:inosine-uridine nucleoside N-ribohydrolase
MSEGVPVYMCGLEIAHEESVPRVKQLELANMPVSQGDTRLQKIAEFMQRLIHNSTFSCTFDPVAATVFINKDFYSFESMRLSCGVEAPNEAKLTVVPEGGGNVHVGVKFDGEGYFKLLQGVIGGSTVNKL